VSGGDGAVAQGSQRDWYTIKSGLEPEAKKAGSRDDPFTIESGPEPEPKNGGEVRPVHDNLTDVLELEVQWLREVFSGGAEQLDKNMGETPDVIDAIEEGIDENFEAERQLRAKYEAV
jgi:hypothetical protein